MTLQEFIKQLELQPESIKFTDTMQVIADNYDYKATQFSNGTVINESGTNEGSCKIFAFAQLNKLTPSQTLHCFGDYYRVDVLQHPQGDDHGNIRNFINTGWQGIEFSAPALLVK